MGEDEKIALVNVKPVNTGCGAPVSELYRQMSNQTPKVYFQDYDKNKGVIVMITNCCSTLLNLMNHLLF